MAQAQNPDDSGDVDDVEDLPYNPEYTRETEHGLVGTDKFYEDHPWVNGDADDTRDNYE